MSFRIDFSADSDPHAFIAAFEDVIDSKMQSICQESSRVTISGDDDIETKAYAYYCSGSSIDAATELFTQLLNPEFMDKCFELFGLLIEKDEVENFDAVFEALNEAVDATMQTLKKTLSLKMRAF